MGSSPAQAWLSIQRHQWDCAPNPTDPRLAHGALGGAQAAGATSGRTPQNRRGNLLDPSALCDARQTTPPPGLSWTRSISMNHPVASVLRGPDVASAALRRFASHWLDPEWGLMHPQAGDERGCPDAIPLFVSLHHDNRSNGSAGGIGWIPTPAEIQTQGHQDSLMPTARPRKQAEGNTKSMTLETHRA